MSMPEYVVLCINTIRLVWHARSTKSSPKLKGYPRLLGCAKKMLTLEIVNGLGKKIAYTCMYCMSLNTK